jgi:hypothetical protein
VEVYAGDVCFLDLSRPIALRAPNYESLTLILPRAALQPHIADLDCLHGRILQKSSQLNAMPVGHLRTLFAEAPMLSSADGRAAANGTAALSVRRAVGQRPGRDCPVGVSHIAVDLPAVCLQLIAAASPNENDQCHSARRQALLRATSAANRVFVKSLNSAKTYQSMAAVLGLRACPKWGQKRHFDSRPALPVYPDQQTFSESVGMSQKVESRMGAVA